MVHTKRNPTSNENHVCPWWLIGFFDNPLRRLVHPPEKILSGLVQAGQRILDIGCGIGYFTIPLAKMVGPSGTVIAADLQKQMLAGVHRRAEKAGVTPRIQLHRCLPDRIGAQGPFDFALAFWMVHEVTRTSDFLTEIYTLLKPGGALLAVEPRIHVNAIQFDDMIQTASITGFRITAGPKVRFSRSVLLMRGEKETSANG